MTISSGAPLHRTLSTSSSLGISSKEDDTEIRSKYRPFLLDEETAKHDWVSKLELDTVSSIASTDFLNTGSRLKVLVLYGSLRKRYTHPLPPRA